MAKTNYSIQTIAENTAKAYGKSLPISLKTSINIANKIRGMSAQKALAYLKRVTELKQAVPFTRFTDGVGHRKGNMASGRFPIKAAKEIGNILASAVTNAANKGLAEELKIIHITANKAATQFHMGRQRRRAMKQTHIEIVVQEDENAVVTKSTPKQKKVVPKKESKPLTEKTVEKLVVLKEKKAPIQNVEKKSTSSVPEETKPVADKPQEVSQQ